MLPAINSLKTLLLSFITAALLTVKKIGYIILFPIENLIVLLRRFMKKVYRYLPKNERSLYYKAYIKESVFRFWSTLYPLLSKGLTEGMKFLITRSKNILRIISTKIKSIPEGYVNELRDQYEMFR